MRGAIYVVDTAAADDIVDAEQDEAFEHVDIVPDKSEGDPITSATLTATAVATNGSPPFTLSWLLSFVPIVVSLAGAVTLADTLVHTEGCCNIM